MDRYIKYICSVLALGILISCGTREQHFAVKPTALGVMNEIVVIADNDIWTSIVGDTTKHFFEGAYPLTPRPEPLFDLRQYEVADIYSQPLKKELRTYLILANLDDTESDATKFVIQDLGEERIKRAKTDPTFNSSVGRDKWANGQILIYIFAHGTNQLADAVERNFNGISSKVNEHDAEQLRQMTYAKGTNRGLSSKMVGKYGAEINIPLDFEVALDAPEENDLMWLRKDTKDGTANIVISIYDYKDSAIIAKEEAKKRFDRFGRFVSSDAPNTFIKVNDIDLPILEFDRTISTRYAKEWRGIWEMENDFMGGPFISYAIVNEKEGKMLSIDTFVFSPGKRKRDILQQIDLIVKRIVW